jgi:quercetin dioxygenase-like cupin family protein
MVCRLSRDSTNWTESPRRSRVISGKQGTMVYWRMQAGAYVAMHQHPHEQFVWVIKGD